MRPALILVCILLSISLSPVSSVYPNDEIILTDWNKTYYLADEIFTFKLVPVRQVPLQLTRHVIYTSSTESVKRSIKRAIIKEKNSLFDFSEEDHQHLKRVLEDDLPSFVRVNSLKRSLFPTETGMKIIPLTKSATILHLTTTKKRDLSESIEIGTFCLHIPFVTTCDNSADLTTVKAALEASINEIDTELDSYTKTNDDRFTQLSSLLTTQTDLISGIVAATSQIETAVRRMAGTVATNAAQMCDGDFVNHAQLNNIKRMVTGLLTFQNAFASTDPRAIVAQPALTELFKGFLLVTEYLTSIDYIPITDSRIFNWTETLLPSNAVTNIVYTTSAQLTSPSSYYYGFQVYTYTNCTNWFYSGNTIYCASYTSAYGSTNSWIHGPFHQAHYGIYPVYYNSSTFESATSLVATGSVTQASANANGATTLNCIYFLGFKVLATFSSTPAMTNGIPDGVTYPLSDCNAYLLNYQTASSQAHYRLFSIYEGIVVPFYSNCDRSTVSSIISADVGYMSGYPSYTSTYSSSVDIMPYEIYAHNFISSECYVNMDPGWIGGSYWINDTSDVIYDIPRGYKLNQFTINPDGELSSSLSFLYTNQWTWVYSIERSSSNTVIVDEVTALDGDEVLFILTDSKVVDESDSFFGEGNNGRDCVVKADTYDYDLLSCFYQNDQAAYTPGTYLSGIIETTGIARFVNKFNFSLAVTDGYYYFSLVPKTTSDFSYYIERDGNLCPKLTNTVTYTNKCIFSFYFTAASSALYPVTLVRDYLGSSPVSSSISFVNETGTISVQTSSSAYTLLSASSSCLVLQCIYSVQSSTVTLETPNVQIVSSDDLALISKISYAVTQTTADTISTMAKVQSSLDLVSKNLTSIQAALSSINWNISELYPYENFTSLRADIDSLIDSLTSGSDSSSTTCSSAFSSFSCFAQHFTSILISLGILVGVIIISYVVCFRFGVADKIKAAFKPKAVKP